MSRESSLEWALILRPPGSYQHGGGDAGFEAGEDAGVCECAIAERLHAGELRLTRRVLVLYLGLTATGCDWSTRVDRNTITGFDWSTRVDRDTITGFDWSTRVDRDTIVFR